jgi:peptidoglycan-associated lipoprotein
MNFARTERSFCFLLFAVIALTSCSKKVVQAPTVPPPPPAVAPPAAPTVTLRATPDSVTRGTGADLVWTSSNATQVTLTPGNARLGTQGTQHVTPNDSTVYTVTAIGPGGQATATAGISVMAAYVAPAAASGPTAAELFQRDVKDALFDYDKSSIRADAKDALSRDADFLRVHPELRFTIVGHCDERGGEEYNLALGDRRADSARDYLVSLGISADRIQTSSVGKERPFCTNENESCYQQNRRGHFQLAQ